MFFPLVLLAGSAIANAKLRIHVIPHSHDDVGWLKTVDQYYAGLNNTIQNANVHAIITTVITNLVMDPKRRFHYGEQAFFQRWWRQQNERTRNTVRKLVKDGQFIFVNGAWSMHDEANTFYVDMIDQTTYGHQFILEEFGLTALPTVGWQLDPFGHSATQASLLAAGVGFDALFFARIHWQDHAIRQRENKFEMLWDASPSLGSQQSVFAGVLPFGSYGPPPSANFFDCNLDVQYIQSDKRLKDYNADIIATQFLSEFEEYQKGIAGDDIVLMAGSDFHWMNAANHFYQLEQLIAAVNESGKAEMFYSTMPEYVKAKHASAKATPVSRFKEDFFPYADSAHGYWTGYFSSRPAYKRNLRYASRLLSAYRKAMAAAFDPHDTSQRAIAAALVDAVAIGQHHDAVTGTAKQHVSNDYSKRLYVGVEAADVDFKEAVRRLAGVNDVRPLCHLTNESRCDATDTTERFRIFVWNPKSRVADALTVIPVRAPTIRIDDSSHPVGSVSVVKAPACVDSYNKASTGCLPYVAYIQFKDVGALGFATARIVPSLRREGDVAEGDSHHDHEHHHHHHAEADGANKVRAIGSSAAATRAKSIAAAEAMGPVTLAHGAGTVSMRDGKVFITTANDDISFVWGTYTSYWRQNEYDIQLQPSGAYIFRPETDTSLTHCGEVFCAMSYESASSIVVDGATVGVDIVFYDPKFPAIRLTMRALGDATGRLEITYTADPLPLIPKGVNGYNRGLELTARVSANGYMQDGVFYTDSNGREMMRREINRRPYPLTVFEPIAGNYYPMTAAASMKNSADNHLIFTTDAPIGVGGVTPGSLEFMVHRVVLHDDWKGVGEPLNESEFTTPYVDGALPYQGASYGRPLVVRGQLWVRCSAAENYGADLRNDIETAYEAPLFAVIGEPRIRHGSMHRGLPFPVTLLTWEILGRSQSNTRILRVAHQLARSEGGKPVTIRLGDALGEFERATEHTITAAFPVSRMRSRLQFNAAGTPVDGVNYNDVNEYKDLRTNPNERIVLNPMEIRTFKVVYA